MFARRSVSMAINSHGLDLTNVRLGTGGCEALPRIDNLY